MLIRAFAANTLVASTCLSPGAKFGMLHVDEPTMETDVDCGTRDMMMFDILSRLLFATAKSRSSRVPAVITGVVLFPRYDRPIDCGGFGGITSPVLIIVLSSLPQAFSYVI